MKTPLRPQVQRSASVLVSLLGLLAVVPTVLGAIPTVEVPVQAWVQRYNYVEPNGEGAALKAVCDAAGDLIVTGISPPPSTQPGRLLTIKYSGADGSVVWRQSYGTSADSAALAVDGNRNVIVVGDYVTIKYLADGTV